MKNPVSPYQQFIKDLRSTLNHFYEPNFLRLNPLVGLLGEVGRLNTPTLVQRLLTEAIEALRPPAATKLCSQAWRTYNLLLYRYLQQLTQAEVASQLGVSVRQLGREQAIALDALACYLWDHYSLGEKRQPPSEPFTAPADLTGGPTSTRAIPAGEGGASPESRSPTKPTLVEDSLHGVETANPLDDLSWLQNQPVEKSADFRQELSTALEIVQSLAAQNAVHIVESGEAASCDLPGLAVHPVALRQLLLSLLLAAIHRAPGRQVEIQVACVDGELEVEVECPPEPGVLPAPGEDAASLQMAL